MAAIAVQSHEFFLLDCFFDTVFLFDYNYGFQTSLSTPTCMEIISRLLSYTELKSSWYFFCQIF